MRTPLLLTATVLGLALLAPLAAAQPDRASRDVVRRTFDVRPTGRLLLDSERGRVEVRTGDGPTVRVEVEREAGRGRALDDFALDFEQRGDEVAIRGRLVDPERYRRDGGNGYRVRYRITVPRRFDVTVRTALGDVTVGDLDGDLDVRTAAASLEIGRVGGRVTAEASAGSITLGSAGGDARLVTSAGSITAGPVGGDLEARTSAGAIEAERVGGTLVATTSAGSIRAALARVTPRGARLETSAGDIALRVPPGAGLVVDAVATGGRVAVDLPRGGGGYARAPRGDALHQAVGGGGPIVTLRTSGGSITVHQAP